jgi:NAD(P)H dehydrogenase (quinone)
VIGMTTLAITGVTGHVGGRIARTLAASSASAPDRALVLVARDPSRAPELGAEVRQAAYGDADAAERAFTGVDVLFLASGGENAHRRAEHRTVIAAAARAGVGHVVYTSFSGASPDAIFTLGRDHADAEAAIRESGMAFTLLRDNFYSDLLPWFAGEDGVIRGPAGDGRVAAVARADVADAAVAALTDPASHANAVYDLTGPEALTLHEVAARGGAALGRTLRYEPETREQAYASRRRWSEEQWQLDAWVSTYTAIADGEVAAVSGDVERVTGHAARTIEQALAEFPA